MKSTFTSLFVIFFCFPFLADAQPPDMAENKTSIKKTYFTKSIEGTAPTIDGVLDDAIWQSVSWGGV